MAMRWARWASTLEADRPGRALGPALRRMQASLLQPLPATRGPIGASALTAAVGLGSYLKAVPVYTEEGGVAGYGAASFIWAATGMAAVGEALGAPASAAPYVVGAAEGLSAAGAVLGSAGFGVLVGSAANCIYEGVNP